MNLAEMKGYIKYLDFIKEVPIFKSNKFSDYGLILEDLEAALRLSLALRVHRRCEGVLQLRRMGRKRLAAWDVGVGAEVHAIRRGKPVVFDRRFEI